ncbi:MAG: phosphatase PAP2 family protein [Verrucomicrobiae bacterium]|nr:phosphatase PAP2 family protein [Verrucomicrobiae bacterium]
MWEQWLNWDRMAFTTLNQHWTHSFLDYFTAIICDQKLFMPILIGLGIVLLIGGTQRVRFFLILAVATLIINDGIVSPTLRHWIHRPRPHEALIGARRVELKSLAPRIRITTHIKPKSSGRSTPSSHMTNNVSIFAIAFLFFPTLRIPIVIWLFLMGYARIYTGAHYPSDILFSIWIALLESALIVSIGFYLQSLIQNFKANHNTTTFNQS